MSTLRFILIAILTSSLVACASVHPQPPEVQLAALEVSDLSLSHANFLATLRLYNPNAFAIDVKGIDFTLYLNDIRVATGKTAKAFNIPAEEFGEAVLHLASSFLDLFQLTTGLQGNDSISYRLAGSVKVGGLGLLRTTIPIEREGKLPLSGSLQRLVPEQSGGISREPGLPGQDRLMRQ